MEGLGLRVRSKVFRVECEVQELGLGMRFRVEPLEFRVLGQGLSVEG